MHRIDGSGAQPNQNGTGKAGFTEGNPGLMIPPTHFTDDWCNAVQEEIANAVTQGGVTLSKPDNTQLAQAVHGISYLAYTHANLNNADITPTPAADWIGCDILELSWSTGNARVLGLAPPVGGKQRKRILNYGDNSLPFVIVNESASVTSTRRIRTPTFDDLIVDGGTYVELWYVFNKWIVMSLGQIGGQQNDIRLYTYPFNAEITYVNAAGQPEPRLREVMINPLDGRPATPSNWSATLTASGPSINSLQGGEFMYYPIHVPAGGYLARARVGVKNLGTVATWNLQVVMHDVDRTAPFAGTTQDIVANVADGVGDGDHILDTSSVGMTQIGSATGRYITLEVVSPSDAFMNIAAIEWIELWIMDPGPRNY